MSREFPLLQGPMIHIGEGCHDNTFRNLRDYTPGGTTIHMEGGAYRNHFYDVMRSSGIQAPPELLDAFLRDFSARKGDPKKPADVEASARASGLWRWLVDAGINLGALGIALATYLQDKS